MSKKEIVVVTEKTVTKKYCDFCTEEAETVMTCDICGKDLCANCLGHKNCDDSGDYYYYTYWCKKCWEIGIPYREQIGRLNSDIVRMEIALEQLHNEWREKCKNQ